MTPRDVPPTRHRVVQWATGNIGTRALREVIRSPALELVGLRVYDPEKEGRDAGTLCGEAETGVQATTQSAVIFDLKADCVLYMPRTLDLDDVVSLLEAGTDVVTTCGELFDDGRPLGEDGRARVLEACERGRSSIYATGSSPGFITDALPFTLLSLQRRVDLIEIFEYADLSKRDSPHMLFQQMGFGRPADAFDPEASAKHLLRAFGPSLGVLAAAAGRPVDEWTSTGEAALVGRPTTIVAGDLAPDTIGARRTTIIGRREGADVVRFTPTWYCTTDVEPAWDLRRTGWRVRIEGDAPFDADLTFPIPLEDLGAHTPAYTANRPVNSIPYVRAARPGILCTADLPPITPAGPARPADQAERAG